jgi:hypothetical protein
MKSSRKVAKRELYKDLLYIFIGIVIALVLSKTGIIDVVYSVLGSNILASFIAGIFFTSAFTIAPASVFLVHVAQTLPINTVAIWGALGAVVGDLILFIFIRDKFADDLIKSMKPNMVKHFFHSLHLGFMKWLSPIVGALIIASPLPDEFALTLMGLSKVRLAVLIPISFIMNMLGIYFIVWFSHII